MNSSMYDHNFCWVDKNTYISFWFSKFIALKIKVIALSTFMSFYKKYKVMSLEYSSMCDTQCSNIYEN